MVKFGITHWSCCFATSSSHLFIAARQSVSYTAIFWWNYALHTVVYTLQTSWRLISILFCRIFFKLDEKAAYVVKISLCAAAVTFPFIEKHPSDWRYTRLLCVYTAVNSRFVYVSHIHHVLESERHEAPKNLFLWKDVLPGLATDFSWPHISI